MYIMDFILLIPRVRNPEILTLWHTYDWSRERLLHNGWNSSSLDYRVDICLKHGPDTDKIFPCKYLGKYHRMDRVANEWKSSQVVFIYLIFHKRAQPTRREKCSRVEAQNWQRVNWLRTPSAWCSGPDPPHCRSQTEWGHAWIDRALSTWLKQRERKRDTPVQRID